MALSSKKSKRIYATGSEEDVSSPFYVDAVREASASESYAKGRHTVDREYFYSHQEIFYQFKLMDEDMDEIRRFATGSGEINVDGGLF
tara:strand:- start:48 stop:311 length:264 start_codon:yes stop_codon:yes gene_type:complete